MTNKTTRRALFTSAMAMLICIAMLVGTTFAWFTDSVTSAKNTIVAGNLDVELDYLKDGNWVNVEGATDLFDDAALWEPGHTEVVYLKVKNAGTLALKYELSMNVVSETKATNVYGEEFALSSYLEYGVVDYTDAFDTRDEARNAVMGVASGFAGKTISGKILAGEADQAFALVVYMPETVGNEANYRGEVVPTIELGVNVVATQVPHEEDSFDDQYDALATYMNKNADGEWEIDSVGSFVYFAQQVRGGNTYAGETVVLKKDVDLAGVNWMPIGDWDNAFSGTFDGNGYTISNLTIDRPAVEGVGLFGVAENATFANININNVDVKGYSMVAAVVGSPYTGCAISNCNVTGNISIVADYAYAGGIFAYGYVSADDCSVIATGTGSITAVNRNAVGGIAAWMLEGDNAITNCEVANLELTGWANVGGVTGFVHYSNTIDNCSVENVTITKTRVGGNPSIGLAAGGYSYNATKAITITDNTFDNVTLTGDSHAFAVDGVLFHGSEYGGTANGNFVLDNNTVTNITNNLTTVAKVATATDFKNAFANGGSYYMSADVTLDADDTLTVPAGKDVKLNLGGNTINATSDATGSNRNLFDARGTLTIENGTVAYGHTGDNMGWGASTNVVNVTAGGVLNVNNATLKNVGGSDMAFAVHMNNWGEVTLNADNAVFESTYAAIRVFNSGNDMNNVNITNSTVKGNNMSFWVHNYTIEDFGTQAKVDTQAALLNFNFIDGSGNLAAAANNVFDGKIRYGFTNGLIYNN